MNSAPLRGRHALVTGGGKGIGAAISASLLAHGARVTLLGRSSATLAAAEDTLKQDGELQYFEADVTSPESLADAFRLSAMEFGGVDILVNNAGQAISAPFLRTDDAAWRQMMSVNLDGVFYCTKLVLPGMLGKGWGRIINLASTAGLTGYAYVSAYCAAKHGVIGLTRALALEVATKGVTVNAICPGYTDTNLVQETIDNIVSKTGRTAAQARDELAACNPQKRLVAPQEVAHAVTWLCLPFSDAINGQSIAVAGGEIM